MIIIASGRLCIQIMLMCCCFAQNLPLYTAKKRSAYDSYGKEGLKSGYGSGGEENKIRVVSACRGERGEFDV